MESKVDATTAHRAYANIIAAGEPVDGGRQLGPLTAFTDHDGYGFTLTNGSASARVLFHNKVAIDTPHRNALQRFVQQLVQVAEDAH